MTGQTASWTRHDGIDTLSPSEKLVYLVLTEDEPLTQKELIEASRLPERTVRAAVTELRDRSLVTRRQSLQDARQHLYSLDSNGTDGAGNSGESGEENGATDPDDSAKTDSRSRRTHGRRAGGSR